jgi:hypothetical protein
VYTGDGLGNFEGRTLLDLGGVTDAGGAQLCDANNDGLGDIAFLTFGSKLGVCLGNGTGGFAPPVFTTGLSQPHMGFALPKLDGDGFPDVVTRHFSGRVQALLGTGTGTFQSPVVFGAVNCTFIGTGDYNGDGVTDVITAGPPMLINSLQLELYPGAGNGTFGTMQAVSGVTNAIQAEVLDLDGNGFADLLYAMGNSVGVKSQTSPGTFVQGWIQNMGAVVRTFTVDDYDADGFRDVIATLDDGRLALSHGQPGGTVAAPTYLTPFGTYTRTSQAAIADVDGDGYRDLLAGCTDNSFHVFPGSASGTFSSEVLFSTVTPSAGRPAVLDVDGDSDLDVVAGMTAIALCENLGVHERPLVYCTAKVNALGCTPAIGASGVASAAASSGFVVSARQVRNKKVGLLMYGVSGRAALPFSGGSQCVRAPIKRSPGLNSGGSASGNDCTGVFSIDMCAFAAGALGGNPLPALRVPGTVVTAEFWGRDPGFAAPNNTTLSDAIEYRVEL